MTIFCVLVKSFFNIYIKIKKRLLQKSYDKEKILIKNFFNNNFIYLFIYIHTVWSKKNWN